MHCFIEEAQDPSAWVEYLPELLMSLRFFVASAYGMSPFLVLFKQEPITFVSLATCPTLSILDGPEPVAID